MKIKPPRHIVWSTDTVDLDDPFQRCWYLKQVLTHGLAKDIRQLNLHEVAAELDNLNLPRDVYALWKTYLKEMGYVERDGISE
jgi:hypothetical protein